MNYAYPTRLTATAGTSLVRICSKVISLFHFTWESVHLVLTRAPPFYMAGSGADVAHCPIFLTAGRPVKPTWLLFHRHCDLVHLSRFQIFGLVSLYLTNYLIQFIGVTAWPRGFTEVLSPPSWSVPIITHPDAMMPVSLSEDFAPVLSSDLHVLGL